MANPSRIARRRRQLTMLMAVGWLAVVFLVLLALVKANLGGSSESSSASSGAATTQPAPVYLDMTGFDPAYLIDDDLFYDATTMSAEQINAFIARVNAGCVNGTDGTVCLAQATFATENRAPSLACPGGYTGGTQQNAGEIIAQVATACNVNPQVLLVLLQKEQGLLTASGSGLSARSYAAATGYACPDTAACDPQWAGFFRQVYGAAAQFQRYRLDPQAYQVVAGVATALAYSPDASCGSGELTVVNQATAGLYDYTPYQPNAAASRGGDVCTSWGNWNFYGYFRSFFGDPTPATP